MVGFTCGKHTLHLVHVEVSLSGSEDTETESENSSLYSCVRSLNHKGLSHSCIFCILVISLFQREFSSSPGLWFAANIWSCHRPGLSSCSPGTEIPEGVRDSLV